MKWSTNKNGFFLSGHVLAPRSYSRIGIFRWLIIVVVIYLGIGIAFYFLQENFLFHPVRLAANYSYHFARPFSEVNIRTNKNENLSLVQFLPLSPVRKGIVLYFHGNMENINYYAKAADIFTQNGYEVWMPDYPGFGKSTGNITEKKLYQIADITYTIANKKYKDEQIIIYGRSLGTGVASQLASIKNCRLLILETPYYSIPDLLSYHVPVYPMRLISKFEIPTHKYLGTVKNPVIIFHGTADKIIPYKSATKLKSDLKPGDEFVSIQGGEHNNLSKFDIWQKKINNLLR